jgi:hypothetical protein
MLPLLASLALGDGFREIGQVSDATRTIGRADLHPIMGLSPAQRSFASVSTGRLPPYRIMRPYRQAFERFRNARIALAMQSTGP